MNDHPGARVRVAARWAVGLVAAATLILAAPTASAVGPVARPFVSVTAKLVRIHGHAFVSGHIVWNAAAVEAHDMSVGDLRLVAVSEHGHRPTLLATRQYEKIATNPRHGVFLIIKPTDMHAIRRGNRVVLTASQHRGVNEETRSERTYVTVAELQRFGTPQDRIGRRDCSYVPIEAGAQMNDCDLVGAYLDRAVVAKRVGETTHMMLADLTGATMRGALLAGLNVAGGRLNGADATGATINNLFLAGAEGTGLIAMDAVSPMGQEGANMFDARLTDADFGGAQLYGVSMEHARLDGSDFQGATWGGVRASTASFRGANLEGLKGTGIVYFADFTDANLRGTKFLATDLEWATLCRTGMPDGFPPGAGYRDCRSATDAGPVPAPDAYVKVTDPSLDRGRAMISAIIQWNAAGIISYHMRDGDLRAVAIDGSTGLPTTVGKAKIKDVPSSPTRYELPIGHLAALNPGNRVVLTATQHQPISTDPTRRTTRSYVTVRTLQAGPGRGRVGSHDCSDVALTAKAPAPDGYSFCDLPGAFLRQAELSGPMRDADLTGARLRDAQLSGIIFDGSAMGGVVATGAAFKSVSMIESFAPGLTIPMTTIENGTLVARSLDDADFKEADISETSFKTTRLRGATFTGATFSHDDLAFAALQKAKLDHLGRRTILTTLFLANLTGATLAGKDSDWDDNEDHQRPWHWATLCDTIMPTGADISGDRDCPR